MHKNKQILTWAITTMILTLAHHAYGALIYDEPFRLHVAVFAVPVIALILLTYLALIKTRTHSRFNIVMLWSFRSLTVLFPVAAIGLYEGGYNHVVKNILYSGGASIEFLNSIYPSVYELPNDFIFEFTGIAQFLAGVLCAYHVLSVGEKEMSRPKNTPA